MNKEAQLLNNNEKNPYKKHNKIFKSEINKNSNNKKPFNSDKKEEPKIEAENHHISEIHTKSEIIKKEKPKTDIESGQNSKKIIEKEEKNDEPKKENETFQKEKTKKVKTKINLNPKRIIKKRTPSVNIDQKNFKKRKNNLNKKLDIGSFFPNKNDNKISTPGLVGLMNIGATCYMNATLQCFSNIPKLREYLTEKKTYIKLKRNKEINKLSFALAEVIKNLWINLEKRFYCPENFKNIISEMNPLFKGVAANDPKDLILFLLENMHKELNIHKSNKDNNNNCIIDFSNFTEVFNNFKESYINQNKSIISDEFYGYQNIITTCNNCQATINNIQIYNILFFPLEEIRKYKNYNNSNVKIMDCFDYFTKIDFSPEFYCNYCKQNYSSNSQTKFVNVPHTLIVNLNRGKGLEYNVNIIFDEYLNLNKYIMDENSPYYYELIGVICHFGSNDMGGHFIAFCKNYNNCEWYKFNDQNVTKCLFTEVKQSGLPYVLFYNYVQT